MLVHVTQVLVVITTIVVQWRNEGLELLPQEFHFIKVPVIVGLAKAILLPNTEIVLVLVIHVDQGVEWCWS